MLKSATPEFQIDWNTVDKRPTPEVSSEFRPSRRLPGVEAEPVFQPVRVEAGDQPLEPGQIVRQR